MRKSLSSTVLLVAAALPLATLPAVAAHADKPTNAGAAAPDHFDETSTEPWPCWYVAPEDPEDAPAPDYVLSWTLDVRGVSSFRRTGRNDAPGFHDTVHGTDTWTIGSGDDQHTLVHVFNATYRDGTVVDQGSTLLITNQGAGNDTWYLDGKRIARNPGTNRVQFEIRHMGTLDDPEDDEFVEGSFTVVKESTGLTELPDIDPCVVLAPFA